MRYALPFLGCNNHCPCSVQPVAIQDSLACRDACTFASSPQICISHTLQVTPCGTPYSPQGATTYRSLQELRKQPYWDRKNGTDHILTVVSDGGGCDLANDSPLHPAIVLHHWGMLVHQSWESPCRLFDHWGGSCDPVSGLRHCTKSKGVFFLSCLHPAHAQRFACATHPAQTAGAAVQSTPVMAPSPAQDVFQKPRC